MADPAEEIFLARLRPISRDLERWCRRQLADGWSLDEVKSRVLRDYQTVKSEKARG